MIALRRFAAFGIDYGVVVAWGAALFLATIATGSVDSAPPTAVSGKLAGHAFAFATMTLPVWLYFSAMEGLGKHATLGKRVLRLSVQANLRRAMLRNAVRFVPWEIAHIAIWYVPGRPFADEMPAFNLTICIVAMALALAIAASVVISGRRGLHDYLAGTTVSG